MPLVWKTGYAAISNFAKFSIVFTVNVPFHAAWQNIRVANLHLSSDYPFRYPLFPTTKVSAACQPDCTFTCQTGLHPTQNSTNLRFTSPVKNSQGQPASQIYATQSGLLLTLASGICYELEIDHINAWPGPCRDPAGLESSFWSEAWHIWLEWRGRPSLHAAVVQVVGGAIAFLADSTGGKSSLAAACLQAGLPLLSDDTLPLQIGKVGPIALPMLPMLRLWPDTLAQFFPESLSERLHPATKKRFIRLATAAHTFCSTPQPLRALYLVQRRSPKDPDLSVRIQLMKPAAALMALLRYSFAPRSMQALGLQFQRMAFFSNLLKHIPLSCLSYPHGFAHLPQVIETVLANLEK